MKPDAPSFERLEKSITIIAQHADYSGKQEAVAGCMAEIEDRWNRGLRSSGCGSACQAESR